MRYVIVMTCLILVGCQVRFGDDVSTTTPTNEQIACCRGVIYINPELEIETLGNCIQSGMDDVICFKFTAKTDDPSSLFDCSQVDSTKFSPNFNVSVLDPRAAEKWWNISSQRLFGGSFLVPPPNSSGTRGLNVGYVKNEDGTLTVYVLWCET